MPFLKGRIVRTCMDSLASRVPMQTILLLSIGGRLELMRWMLRFLITKLCGIKRVELDISWPRRHLALEIYIHQIRHQIRRNN
jgi:hypothetical protein